jgi:hypothetical protein
MIDRHHHASTACRAVALLLLGGLGVGLAGCADMSDTVTSAFADPSKYDSYDCKQLQATRKYLAAHAAEVQGLIAKAETGTAGPVIAEMAYRNDYISTRASANLADEVWRRNNCIAVQDKPGEKLPDPQAGRPVDQPIGPSLPRTGIGGGTVY